MRKAVLFLALLATTVSFTTSIFAQGPGYIVRQAGASNLGSSGIGAFPNVSSTTGRAILNPDYSSPGTDSASNYATQSNYYKTKWTASDDVTGSEIPYAAIPPYSSEPYSDLRRGPGHLYSDFVPSGRASDLGASYYMYLRGNGTTQLDSALCFRMRMGSIIPGAKAYSILIDADGKFGATGPNADPNYVAATTGVNGNPGFELEIDLFTQASGIGVAIYNIDGKDGTAATGGTLVASWTANDYTQFSQVAIAGTNDNGDPDFYLDWFVPWNKIRAAYPGLTTSTQLRFIPTTVMAPQPAIGGPKSDIYGLNDANYPNPNTEYETLLSAMPGFTLSQLAATPSGGIPGSTGTNGTNNTQLCTAAPTITSVVPGAGTGSVSGNWSKLSISTVVTPPTIYIYKNGSTTSFATATPSNGNWVANGLTINTGDVITAQAQAAGENMCQVSNTVTVTSCSSATWQSLNLAAPSGGACLSSSSAINQTSPLKGLEATNRNSASWKVYMNAGYANTTQNSTSNVGSTAFSNNGSASTWTYSATGNWQYAKGCSGGSGMTNDTYTIWYQDSITGCKSNVTLLCGATGGGSGLAGILLTPTMSPATITNTTNTIKVVGAAGSFASLYVNGEVVASATLPGTFNNTTKDSINFSNLSINIGDSVSVVTSKVQGTLATSYCAAKAPSQIVALCTTPAPLININNTTGLINVGSSISGTGLPGATIKLYNSTNTNTVLATVTVGVNGQWTTGVTAIAGNTYYATAQSGSCSVSANSPNATASNGVTSGRCGAITTANITTTTTPIQGTVTSGTANATVNLYEDGYLVGSTTVAAGSTAWSIAVSNLYAGDGFSTGKLTIGIQEPNMDEQICTNASAIAYVNCTQPAQASLTFVSCTSCANNNPATLQSGGTLTYTISGALTNSFYALRDSLTGKSLGAGTWATSTSFNMTTDALSGAGNYKVQVVGTTVSGTNICSSTGTASKSYAVLPVELLEFTARKNGNTNLLKWKTSTEINASHFEVMKSTDGISFAKIGSIYATGSGSVYNFTDAHIEMINYYQLRMVDIDGRFKYSRIIILRNDGTTVNTVRPNPFTNEINVQLYLGNAQSVTLQIVDASGRVAATKQINGVQGLNDIQFNNLSALSKGVYVLKVLATGTTFQEKLLKVN